MKRALSLVNHRRESQSGNLSDSMAGRRSATEVPPRTRWPSSAEGPTRLSAAARRIRSSSVWFMRESETTKCGTRNAQSQAGHEPASTAPPSKDWSTRNGKQCERCRTPTLSSHRRVFSGSAKRRSGRDAMAPQPRADLQTVGKPKEEATLRNLSGQRHWENPHADRQQQTAGILRV